MKHLTTLDWTALVLLVIGGLNWGMIGIFNFNLVSSLFGAMTTVTRTIYSLVGLSALLTIFTMLARKE